MSEQELFILADESFCRVIDKINDDQWDMKIPEWFPVGRAQTDMDLRKIVNYHAYDEAWVPETLAGKTIAEVGTKYDGDLLGEDPKAAYAELAKKARIAVNAIDDPQKMVHLTYGDWPAREYLKHISSFRGFRTYHIAKLIGTSTTLPDKLVQGLWDMLVPEVEDWRTWGVFGPEIKVLQDAPLQERLLGLAGYKP